MNEQAPHQPTPAEQPENQPEKPWEKLVRGYLEMGIRLTQLTKEELKAMSVDELYQQLTESEQISSEWDTCGGVIEQQLKHRALVKQIYAEKIAESAYAPKTGPWDAIRRLSAREVAALPIAESYRLYCRERHLSNLHLYD